MLEAQLADQRARAYAMRDPVERAVRANAIDAVAASGLAEHALSVGQKAPSFVLADASGGEVALEKLLAGGPVVVCFYRGGWCPYCNLELRAYQQKLGEIHSLGAALVAVSPERTERALHTRDDNGLQFPLLWDVGNTVARRFRITHKIDPQVVAYQLGNGNDVAAINGDVAAEVPLPATYVIDTTGIVRYAFVAADYTRRAEPDDVIAALHEICVPVSLSATRGPR